MKCYGNLQGTRLIPDGRLNSAHAGIIRIKLGMIQRRGHGPGVCVRMLVASLFIEQKAWMGVGGKQCPLTGA